MTENVTDVNDLLDSTLDDLEDLPSFEPFPPGVHKVSVSMELKDISGKVLPEMSIVGIETLELSEPTKTAPIKAGDTCSVLFMLDNKFGAGNFKKLAAPLRAALFGDTPVTNRELIEAIKDVECVIVSSVRKDAKDPDKLYMKVKDLEVL